MQAEVLFGRYVIEANLNNMPIAEEAQQRLDYQKQTVYKSLLVAFADQIIWVHRKQMIFKDIQLELLKLKSISAKNNSNLLFWKHRANTNLIKRWGMGRNYLIGKERPYLEL